VIQRAVGNLTALLFVAPLQPGNSSGPLVNEQRCLVRVVTAQMSDAAAISETGAIPQNVNHAAKSAFVLPFVENIQEIKQATKPAFQG